MAAAGGTCDQVLAALQGVQAALGRHRPLARVRQQLLGDLAALLSGLRVVLMLDYAPGTTPQQLLAAVLTPVQQALPAWQGCILELEGCCYVAASGPLLQHLSELSTDPASWPAVVCFPTGASEPQLMQPQDDTKQQLQRQIQQLHAVVAVALQQPDGGDGVAGQRRGDLGPAPVINLGSCQGRQLPAMPTLNGLLLGYPVVYCVHSLQEAAAASRVLSASQLQLHRVTAKCGRQLGALLLGAAAGGSSSKAGGLLPQSDHQAVCLMSFTVPVGVSEEKEVVEERVAARVARLQHKTGGDSSSVWEAAVEHSVRVVGPQAVSL